MKQFDNPSNWAILIDRKTFIIQKKDGTRIGIVYHLINQPDGVMEIGYFFLFPANGGKGMEQKRFS